MATVALPAFAVFLIGLVSAGGASGVRYPQWVQTSAAFHEQLLLAGPVVAAVSCYAAVTLCRPGSVLSLPSSARVGAYSAIRTCAVLCAWFALAYIAGLLPTVVGTVVRATAGGPDLLALGVGVLGLAALVVLGYVVGVLASSPLAVPATAAAVFVLLQLPVSWLKGLQAVSPYLGVAPTAGRMENPLVLAYKLLFLAVLVAALLVAAGALLRHRYRPVAVRAAALTVLLVPGALAVVPLVRTPAVLTAESTTHAVCDRAAEVPVCVHAAYRHDLPQVTAIAAKLFAAYPVSPGLSTVLDTALVDSTTPRPPEEAWVDLSPYREPGDSVAEQVARALIGVGACADKGPVRGVLEGLDLERYSYADRLTRWLLTQAGHGTNASRSVSDDPATLGAPITADEFTGEDPATVRSWIVAQHHQLRTCSLPADELR